MVEGCKNIKIKLLLNNIFIKYLFNQAHNILLDIINFIFIILKGIKNYIKINKKNIYYI